ncbi:hypothetical protein [Runella slithyformis]|uniref:Uncharacterized protein n=1 Tax=Runella slithyformis (strain ATCC 29530 / DSM 19594 / LMG 11500 / NCIMB 11436 / LSU 4) TaxID=761193 RepID=A0A7U4E4T6_RUNSL|nr:hypothetical protein [Runella slithyformis]AEI47634.1 hypothetical protein Runsl_1205 [Runella slithyformis DSM 19594]
MNAIPKNTTIYTPIGRAELFFQVVNCDHIMFQYLEEMVQIDHERRQHDVTFTEIAKMLTGNVLIEQVPKSQNKYYAVSYYKSKYYYTIFYLNKRADSQTLFAIIVTSYATNKKEIREKYESYLRQFNNA